LESTITNLRSKLGVAENDLARATEQCQRQEETIEQLKQDNLDQEKRLADSAAQWRRMINQTKRAAQERELEQNERIFELEAPVDNPAGRGCWARRRCLWGGRRDRASRPT